MNRDLLMYFGNSQPPIYLQSFLKVCSYFENTKNNETEPNKNLLLLVYFGNSQSSIYLRTSLKVYIAEDFENIKKIMLEENTFFKELLRVRMSPRRGAIKIF